MALTTDNYTLDGVLKILAQSSGAIDSFKTTALKGATTKDQLMGEIQRLKRREDELLSVFGGRSGLEKRITDFKKDASNFSGIGLGKNFTIPYESFMDASARQFQEEFEQIFLTAVREEFPLATKKELPNMIIKYLNEHKKDFEMEGILTEHGTKLTKIPNVQSVKGMNEGENMIVRQMTKPVQRRIQAAIKALKKNSNYKVKVKNSGNIISASAGATWAKTVTQLTPEQIKSLTPAELKKINNHIIEAIINGMGLSKYRNIARRIIQTEMLAKEPLMFFKSKGNANDITGLIGEICAMILFFDLTHSYPSISWAATHKDLSGNQDSADIIINEGLGIQVKNTTKDLNTLEGLAVSFKNVNLSTLGESLGFDDKFIENLYDTQVYNVGYTWEHERRGNKNIGIFNAGNNSKFSGTEREIEVLIEQFENIMSSYAADLMYMASSGTSAQMFSGEVGNVLYMVALKPYYATEILQDIINTLDKNRGERSLLFSAYRKKSTNRSIIEDLPSIYDQTKAGEPTQFGKGSMKFKTSYIFKE